MHIKHSFEAAWHSHTLILGKFNVHDATTFRPPELHGDRSMPESQQTLKRPRHHPSLHFVCVKTYIDKLSGFAEPIIAASSPVSDSATAVPASVTQHYQCVIKPALPVWLVGWLAGWLVGQLVGWLDFPLSQ
jgi:hypothetical protein